MNEARTAPRLDILIAAPASANRLVIALEALQREFSAIKENANVSIVVARGGVVPAEWRDRFCKIHWIECDQRATLPELWGRAIAESDREWIAILDADCPVGPGWLERALKIIEQKRGLVGGAVEPRGLHSRTAWAAYFCDYGAFLPPLSTTATRELAGNNLLIRRQLLARAPQYASPRFWKAHFVRTLAQTGISGENEPALVIYYEKNYSLTYWLHRRYVHARCFASMRVVASSSILRAMEGLLSLLLPFVLLLRLVRIVLPKRRYTREFFIALPWIFAGLCAWAAGEWRGYWFGAGNSCEEIF